MYIPYGRQEITKDDIDSVIEVLKSDFITQGPKVPQFEAKVVNYCNADYAIAFNSATSALHAACLSLGLGPGDWIWTSPITFVASANCGLYCGAKVDFVDIDSTTYNLCSEALELKLIKAEQKGKLPKILVPVHLCGLPCDMKKIHQLAKKYQFKIIEDAAHAIGSKYLSQQTGNCQFSDITIFSFHPVKIITTAEGGMALTKSIEIANKMELLRSHGITRKKSQMKTRSLSDGRDWYYEQVDLGFNYRMTDIQAALGISQMNRIEHYITKRNELADRYDNLLEPLPLTTPSRQKDSLSSFHLYVILLDKAEIRDEIFSFLRKKGIGVNVHYIPVHTQPYYKGLGFEVGDYPKAELYYSKAMSLPLFPTMTQQEQDFVVKELRKALV